MLYTMPFTYQYLPNITLSYLYRHITCNNLPTPLHTNMFKITSPSLPLSSLKPSLRFSQFTVYVIYVLSYIIYIKGITVFLTAVSQSRYYDLLTSLNVSTLSNRLCSGNQTRILHSRYSQQSHLKYYPNP